MNASDTIATSPDTIRALRNGGRVRLRSPRDGDQGRVEDCFAHLSEASRRFRFFAPKKALTPKEVELLTLTDGVDHIAVAALALDAAGAEGQLVGMARCFRLAGDSRRAELALAVADAMQGQGLGHALIEQLMQAAAAQGIEALDLDVLAANAGMRKLAAAFDAEVLERSDGVMRYRLAVQEGAATAPEREPMPWLGLEVPFVSPSCPLVDVMRQDWLDGTDRAYRLGQGLAEAVWRTVWESWHLERQAGEPASSELA